MDIFVTEAKKLTVVDYFDAFCCELFSVIELLEEIGNWCRWIPTCSHAIEIGSDIGVGYGSGLSV